MTSIFRLAGAILTLSVAFIQPATAAPYVDMGDNTLADAESELVWAKDARVPSYQGCNGGAKVFDATEEYLSCLNEAEYLGRDDWRIPTLEETTVAIGGSDAFDGLAGTYWTSTPATAEKAYAVNARTGAAAPLALGKSARVLLVAGEDQASVAPVVLTSERAEQSEHRAAKQKFSLTAVIEGHGKITPATKTVSAGASATLTVLADKGYMISAASVDGEPVDMAMKDLTRPVKILLKKIGSNHEIKATFIPKTAFPTVLPIGNYTVTRKYCFNSTCTGTSAVKADLTTQEGVSAFLAGLLREYDIMKEDASVPEVTIKTTGSGYTIMMKNYYRLLGNSGPKMWTYIYYMVTKGL